MYTFLAKLAKFISYTLRFIQVLGAIYFVLYVVYWICAMCRLGLAKLLEPLYSGVTNNIVNFFGISVSKEFSLLHLDILIAIFVVLVVLLLSNFVFVFTGSIERFFVDNSYKKGEHDRK